MTNMISVRADHVRLDAAAAPTFKQELEMLVGTGQRRVMLDLSQVQFIDSTGLGVLVSLLKRMGADGRIAIIGAGPSVVKLFQLTRLDTLFRICKSQNEAQDVLAA